MQKKQKTKKGGGQKEAEKALLYRLGGETETGRKLRDVLAALNIEAVTVTEEMCGKKVKAILKGRKQDDNTDNAPEGADLAISADEVEPVTEYSDAQEGMKDMTVFDDPFMLLSGLSDRKLDALLDAMMRDGISVEYKAVATESNRHWIFGELMREVRKEHLIMRMQQKN